MKTKSWLGALSLAVGMLAATAATAADVAWTSIGPAGGFVSALAIDPLAPQTVYAAAYGAGVFRTTDGAASWQPMNDGLPNLFTRVLAIDPATPSTLYAAGDLSGLAKSVDGGSHWETVGLFGLSLTALALDPQAPRTLYVVVENGIAKSTDGGATFGAIVSSGALSTPISALAVDPRRSNFVYAATSQGFARSTDGGLTWTRAGTLDGAAKVLLVSPQQSATVYAGQLASQTTAPRQAGFFVSKNGGRSWTRSSRGLGTAGVLSIAMTAGRLYAGTDTGGVFVSTDGGANWAPAGHGTEATTVNALAVDPAHPSTLYAGSGTFPRQDAALRKTTDAGATWTVANRGLAACQISALAVDPANSGHLVTGTIGALGIFARPSAGTAWVSIDTGLPALAVSSLAFDPHDASGLSIYGIVHGLGGPQRAHLVATTDGGEAWTPLTVAAGLPYVPLRSSGGLAVAPDRGNTVYVGTHAAVLTVAGGGAATTVGTGIGNLDISAVLVAPSSPNVLYASGLPSIHGGPSFYRSDDHGATWTALPNPELPASFTLAVDSADARTVFAAGETLHRSTDGGATWSPAGPGGPVAGLATGPGVAYVVILPGIADPAPPPTIWRSLDSGSTWTPFSDVPPRPITLLVVDPSSPSTLYAGTTAGVYVLNEAAPASAP